MTSRRIFTPSGRRMLGLLSAALLCATGCNEAPDSAPRPHLHTAQTHGELRPTDPDDPMGYEGAATDSIVSPNGYARIWWATEGDHQPPGEDSDDNGVPDFVDHAVQLADELAIFTESEGWRLPLVVDEEGGGFVSMDQAPLDIYLVDFSAGDGHYRREQCGFQNGQEVCAGHLRMENDFSPLYYPTREHGLKVVLVHEYFHAVQAAYHAEIPAWWSEGGATWFEEYYWPEQDDFERLTDYYFEEYERSLHDRQRGAFDSYAYGASLFVYFLALHLGAEGVQAIHDQISEGKETERAVADLLESEFAPLAEAFELFAVWNLFTGSRAVAPQGYPDAGRFSQVSFVELDADQAINWNQEVDPLAVRYARIDGERPVRLSAEAIDERQTPSVAVVTQDQFADTGAYDVLRPDDGPSRVYEPEEFPLYLAVSNGDLEEDQAIQIQLRHGADAEDAEDDTDEEVQQVDGDESRTGGCTATGVNPAGSLPALILFCLMALKPLRRRAK